MPMVPQEEWQPLEPEDPRWEFLMRLDPRCTALPGTWEVRGDLPADWESYSTTAEGHIDTDFESPTILRANGIDFRYRPPARVIPRRSGIRRWWTAAVGVVLKFKALLVFGSVLLNLLVYGLAFGWAFAAGLVAVIAIHESGHVVANRRKGIPASLPVFIPFLGAFIGLRQMPQNAADEAFIGIMGPLFGLGASVLALILGVVTKQAAFFAIAEVGFLMHVFNLMPVIPLDGGRSVAFWGWKAWIPGILGMLLVLFYNPLTHQFTLDPVTAIILIIVVVSLLREPRRRSPVYNDISIRDRVVFGSIWAFALLASMAGYWLVGTRLVM
ncbi:site-2 protease family protein [Sulfobacillus harzensis]|uniref:Site-2 protease family protein n=1 Tax=Sulfobacillus harzensis TaxID=2729629 RepID=A0A7Y0L547_9FIRM|nr:site-2 protease family protein [Sulfobacillus harzensis]NMP23137.1 site-2 protease family protein [Sulfobacillus harzensis]